MVKKIKIIKSKVPNGIINQALALQAMEATEGWAIMKKNTLDNIEYLEECILEKKQDGMPLNDLAVDRLRDKRGFLKELVNLPEKFAKKLETGKASTEDFDPYFSDVKELIKNRK
jgi:hypothetical protein